MGGKLTDTIPAGQMADHHLQVDLVQHLAAVLQHLGQHALEFVANIVMFVHGCARDLRSNRCAAAADAAAASGDFARELCVVRAVREATNC